jgi:small subunit ribosomal protein S12
MATLSQLIKHSRDKRAVARRSPLLINNPQLKATIIRLFKMTPRKPNSALRQVARVLVSGGQFTSVYIPGITQNLAKHSTVYIRGGAAKDLPAVRYSCIRGKGDLVGLTQRHQGRSKYGTPRMMASYEKTRPYRRKKLW